MQETQVRSLGREDLLEKEMATQCSFLENSLEKGARQARVHRVAKSQTGLSTHAHRQLLRRNWRAWNSHPLLARV